MGDWHMVVIIKRLMVLRDAIKASPDAHTPEHKKTCEALIEALNTAIEILATDTAVNKKLYWAEMAIRIGLILFIYFCLTEAIYVCYIMSLADPVLVTKAQMAAAAIVAALWIVKVKL